MNKLSKVIELIEQYLTESIDLKYISYSIDIKYTIIDTIEDITPCEFKCAIITHNDLVYINYDNIQTHLGDSTNEYLIIFSDTITIFQLKPFNNT